MLGDILSIVAYVILIAVTVVAVIYLTKGFTKMYKRKKAETVNAEVKEEVKAEKK